MAYEKIKRETVEREACILNNHFNNFLLSNGFGNELSFSVNNTDLSLIIRKVDQRKHYFREFHTIEMSELKEVSLFCFWLIKFRPYRINSNEESVNDSINEKFCVYFILHTIRNLINADKSGKATEAALNYISKEYLYQLTYSFRFRDISKEALILLTETIALMCGIKPYHDLDTISNVSESEIE